MRAPIRTFAGTVSKYARIGLVLFYALQISVLFREHIANFYRTALETVHEGGGVSGTPVAAAHPMGDKHRDDRRPLSDASVVAASSVPATMAVLAEEHPDSEAHTSHDGNDNKDRARRHRRDHGGEWFIRNLVSTLRRMSAPHGSDTAYVPTTLRQLSFAA